MQISIKIIMNANRIKNKIISCYSESIAKSASNMEWHTHPIRLIQAVKSLIGIDIDRNNKCLLQWLMLYLENNELENYHKPISDFEFMEVVSLKNLNQAILNNDANEAHMIVQNLCRVSDGRPILEYLLELSLKQSGLSFLMIKSIIKSNLFMKNSKIEDLIHLGVNALLDFTFYDSSIIENSKGLKNEIQLEILINLIAIQKEEFIREKSFETSINNAINKFHESICGNQNATMPINLISEGRLGLLEFLNSLEVEEISPEMILFFDSVRNLIYVDKDFNKLILSNIINNYIKGL